MVSNLVKYQRRSLIPNAQEFEVMKSVALNAVQSGVYPQKTKEQALAAILAGWEVGIGHREALDGFAAISGRLSPSAQMQLAQILRTVPEFEHVWIEMSDKRAAMKARRKPTHEWSFFEYTMAEAVLAGLATKDVYRKHPVAMLANRCTDRMAGFLAPDGMGGGAYNHEVAASIPARNEHVPMVDGEAQAIQELSHNSTVDSTIIDANTLEEVAE